MSTEPPHRRGYHPSPQPLPPPHRHPSPRSWSRTQRSAQNWLVLCAALFLLGTSDVLTPLRHEASGAWQQVFAPDARALELDQIVSRLEAENDRLERPTLVRIGRAIQGCERNHGVPSQITLAVMIVESNVRPAAVSPKGAIGLMQVMPHMFEGLGLPGNIAHLESNIEAGCILLADNMRRLGEDRGISAYFWGTRIRGDDYLSKVKAVRDTFGPEVPSVSAGMG